MKLDPNSSHQRARLVARHPGGRVEVLTCSTSRAVWALYTEIRERELLADTVPLEIEVLGYLSPFAP